MSRVATASFPVLHWSTAGYAVYDPLSRQVRKFVNLAEAAAHIPGGRCVVALSRRSTFLRCVRVPNAGHAEVAQALAFQADSLFPLPSSELAWTFRLTEDVTSEGRLAVLIAAPLSTLKSLDAELRAHGVAAEAVLSSAFGSMLLAEALGKPHAAVLERTDEGLAIDVIYGGELQGSRLVPEPRTDKDLEAEICRSFAIAGLPCGPAIAAGGASLGGVESRSELGTLELLSSGGARLGVHLELPDVAAKREAARVRSRARLALLAVVAALACAGVLVADRMAAQANVRSIDARWDAELRKLEGRQKTLSADAAKASAQEKLLRSAFDPAQNVSDIVVLAGNLAPQGVWLGGLTVERGKPVLLRGTATRAESVTAYLDSLSAQERFRDVKLVFANNALIETTPVVNYSISMHAVGNLPIVLPKTGGARR